MKLTNRVSGLAVLAVCASTAWAGIQVRDRAGGENSNGSPGGFFLTGTGSSIRATATGHPTIGNMALGVYDFEANYGDGWQPLLTFCTEPTVPLRIGNNRVDQHGLMHQLESLTDNGFTASEAGFLEVLWANAFSLATTDKMKAAAFQALIWELKQDSDFNLGDGRFRMAGGGYTYYVRQLAREWANNIINGVWTRSVSLAVLANRESQDLLTPVVPEPAAATAGLVGLASLAFFRRR